MGTVACFGAVGPTETFAFLKRGFLEVFSEKEVAEGTKNTGFLTIAF